MSKHINVNPGQYTEGGREHQGEGIIHGNERNEYERAQPGRQGPDEPHIPNEERAGQPSHTTGTTDDETAGKLSDDEGMID